MAKANYPVLVCFTDEQIDCITKAIAVTGHKRVEFIRHAAFMAAQDIVQRGAPRKDFDLFDWLLTPEQQKKFRKMFFEPQKGVR